jgi:primosomal protein N' (replication factor Y)
VPNATTHVRNLEKSGWIEIGERVVRGDAFAEHGQLGVSAPAEAPELNPLQKNAVGAILGAFEAGEYRSFVVHGITGSGKTEVYLGTIAKVLEAGRGAIVLVPEISLTPQLASRFRARFGDLVAVLHSGLTDRERFDEWYRIREGNAPIALGARSAIFAPVPNLGMVVVDEEHDSSFKQEEGVRYNARDVALVRAQRAGAVCVLGSATPSMESYRGTEVGRHTLIELPERATPRPLPEVELVDLRKYKPDGETMLSSKLADAIEETVERGEQVILFLNRRGFNTFVVCTSCGHAFRCTDCSVSLTYHRYLDKLVCHHCGLSRPAPKSCPECTAETIVMRGMGTERVAEGIAARFPFARIERLDRDIAQARGIQTVLGRFARHESDILVGTQMVTKGHDFPGVTLVGVLSADAALSLPDFRASERTFQLLSQVAGRAGRGDKPGRVLIQTFRPEAAAIRGARDHDYKGFYSQELVDRQELGYPPAGHLVALRIDGPDAHQVQRTARQLADVARAASAGEIRILGPSEAPLARLQGRTRWHLWLAGSDRKPLRAVVRRTMAAERQDKGVRVTVDVDPISAL